VWALCATLAGASCATAPAPKAEVAPHPEPARVKLAVLPVENDAYPAVATAVNSALRSARVQAVDEYFISKVTLEVVQLSIECVDATDACYTAVGRSLSANMLLMAQIGPEGGGRAGRKHANKAVQVRLTVFNVDRGTPKNVVSRSFKNSDEAVAAVPGMLAETVAEKGGAG
jgi:hypothetical protein